MSAPRDKFALSYGCEHERPERNKNDRGTVNIVSTALAEEDNWRSLSGLKTNRNRRGPFMAWGGFPLAESADRSLIQALVSGRLNDLDFGHVSPRIETQPETARP